MTTIEINKKDDGRVSFFGIFSKEVEWCNEQPELQMNVNWRVSFFRHPSGDRNGARANFHFVNEKDATMFALKFAQ